MKIINTLEFNNNDVYFFEIINEKIVVNNNNNGLIILDLELNTVNNINLFEDILIYDAIINPNGNELLLYCEENDMFIYVNILSNSYFVIDIDDNYRDTVFNNKSLWSGDSIYIEDYEKNLYEINRVTRTIKLIKNKKIDLLNNKKEYIIFKNDKDSKFEPLKEYNFEINTYNYQVLLVSDKSDNKHNYLISIKHKK